MDTVLISTRPAWCGKILSGEKYVEVRKSRPYTTLPFKALIYMTKLKKGDDGWLSAVETQSGVYDGEQKVIAEFTCFGVSEASVCVDNDGNKFIDCMHGFEGSMLSESELIDYGGKVGKSIFGWEIGNIKIYEKPKELKEFGIKKAPQSWCYVR